MRTLLVHGCAWLVVAMVLEATAQAALLSHSGTNDPVGVEGWTQKDIAPFPGGVTAGVAPDSTASWQINDNASGALGYYRNVFAGGDLPSGSAWVQTVQLRVASNTNEQAVFSFVYDGTTYFHFYYTTGKLRYLNSVAVRTDLLTVDNTTGFRTYEFAYDPGSDQIDISVDNVFQTSLARSSFYNAANTPSQGFGAGDYGGKSDSRWAEVSLAIPEPASVAMLSLGGLLVGRKRRA